MYRQPRLVFNGLFIMMLVLFFSGCQFILPKKENDKQAVDHHDGSDLLNSSSVGLSVVKLLDQVETARAAGDSQGITQLFENWEVQLDLHKIDDYHGALAPSLVSVGRQFFRDPKSAIRRAAGLRPTNYDDAKALAVLRSYMYWWIGDCTNAFDQLSSFKLANNSEAGSWSKRIWQIVLSSCIYDSPKLSKNTNEKSTQDWWDLATLIRDAHNPGTLYRSYTNWITEHRTHLASAFIPEPLREQQIEVKKIALLLPQNGPLSSAGDVIRNGFLSAQIHSTPSTNTTIKIYDSTNANIMDVVTQAIDEDADIIVGPLDKDRVRQILEGGPYSTPIITLNHSSVVGMFNSQVIQMAMLVEDDARAIVDYLQRHNLTRILVVMGKEFWSIRAGLALGDLASDSIQIIDELTLNELGNVSEQVADVLLVEQSTNRHREVESISNNQLEFMARRRNDIDAVVVFTEPTEFAAVVAALHYHFAEDIPVITTEPSFRNLPQSSTYSEGTLFTAMPASLYQFDYFDSVKQSFIDATQHFPLYIFGADAYRIVRWFPSIIAGHQLIGYTGLLQKDQYGIIQRKPIWGTISNRNQVAKQTIAPMFHRPNSLL